jgi:hypothetical protein
LEVIEERMAPTDVMEREAAERRRDAAAEQPAERRWIEANRRRTRRERLVSWSVLGATVTAPVLVAVLLDARSQAFLFKAVAIVVLAGLPGWLYLEFVRSKGYSLYDEYVINLFRLRVDRYCNLPAPPRHTSWHALWKAHHDQLDRPGKDNLYRRRFEAVFGRHAVSTRALLWEEPSGDATPGADAAGRATRRGTARRERPPGRGEPFRPVLVASLLLAIGWTVVLSPELFRSLSLTGPLPYSGRPVLPGEALRFGFVGAYWFILQDLVRRYFRDDLKTSAYLSASARLIVVVVVVATMSLVPLPVGQQAVLAFLVGIFPQLGVQVIRAAVGKLGRWMIPNLQCRYPLSDLDGMSIWDEARLSEEAIEDLHGLVTANLVDTLLHTRVPIARLVDWLDQAVLYLRLPMPDDGGKQLRHGLRALGIRTATDLERAWPQPGGDEGLREAVVEALGGGARGVAVAGSLLRTFHNDVNLVHVRAFRDLTWLDDGARADRQQRHGSRRAA